MSLKSTSEDAARGPAKPQPITDEQFFEGAASKHPEGVQGIVVAGRTGQPNDHLYCPKGEKLGAWMARKAKDRKPAYFTMAAYAPDTVSRFKGRTANNVVALRGFWVDLEGSAEKYERNAEGGYPDGKAALRAVKEFCDATGLTPNYLVLTGSGGVHLHVVLAHYIDLETWQTRAGALVKLAARHQFKIDAQCTTDAARIMRAPGSIHQKTGETVKAFEWRVQPYSLAEFDTLVKYDPQEIDASSPTLQTGTARGVGINADVLGAFPKVSYRQAAAHCAAMAFAAKNNGRGVLYPVWTLAVKTAELSVEGRTYAHEVSRGHEAYDAAETDRQIDSLTGGPASCEAWSNAYGVGGPCDTCEFKGKIKNPAVQFGALVDISPPGTVAAVSGDQATAWVAELNRRFALVRIGSKVCVMDFQTPSMAARGIVKGMNILDLAGFRTVFNGRFAPVQKVGEKPRPLTDAWLCYPARRQYEGLVYAPGQILPPTILNLWQGFALEPVAGDVAPWLDVLAALVPIESERRYVLRWLAWKIQNPGGVPDTILIFKGAKGTGKNSLFEPLITLFGRHAMLADDPELIAGRFTWHLMLLSLAVLDEAVFSYDPRQADRLKCRTTAKTMMYEQKGMDPVQGVNRCAYVMLTNHEYVWQATTDERRAVVIEVGESLRENLNFWGRYHAWCEGDGPAALLRCLQGVDLTGFNPRAIPKGEALQRQIELTALRTPSAAWWHQCLSEGVIRWRDGVERVSRLQDDEETEIDRAGLRLSYEQSAAVRGRAATDWAAVSRRLKVWAGEGGLRKTRARVGNDREWREVLCPLPQLRAAFAKATGVHIDD